MDVGHAGGGARETRLFQLYLSHRTLGVCVFINKRFRIQNTFIIKSWFQILIVYPIYLFI